MDLNDLLLAKRAEILQLAAKHGARNVRVFGSASRKDTNDNSDVDFLIEVAPVHSPFFPGGLLADLEELLGRRVDIVTEKGLHWYIREQVLKEAVPL